MTEVAGALKSKENCAVCLRPLVYATAAVPMTCRYCGAKADALIYCPEGHYVCDACHSRAALDVIRQIVAETKSADPAEIAELIMSHPSVPMHGPEHHVLVAAAIVKAALNAGFKAPENAVEKAIERASKVPGGWCGLYGDCGAGVGVGVAVSVLTGATPLTGKQRSLAIGATSVALSHMLDDQPRCCKRAVRLAMDAAVDYLRDRMGVALTKSAQVACTYTARNAQCPKEACLYYSRQ